MLKKQKQWWSEKAASVLIRLFNLLPVKQNKIFMFSYYGSQYGCNPKYITEYIHHHYPAGRFDVVWAFNYPNPEPGTDYGFRQVKTMSVPYFYEMCTSKVIITNYRTTDLFIKRKQQHYIQTWHSSLRLKKIEKDAGDSLPADYIKMAKSDSLKCDLLLSGCKYSSEIFSRSFWYKGKIFEHGTPRNDLLVGNNPDKKKAILKKLNVPPDHKVVLYAPTFRKDSRMDYYNLDYPAIVQTLQKKYKSNWTFLIKLHPHLSARTDELHLNGGVMDVTAYDDMQELLSVADILISDYSSLIFDFAITKRPCFLYVPDIEAYSRQDRELYFDLQELPFSSSTSNEELLKNIRTFNVREYNENLTSFLEKIGSFEQGNACQVLLEHIENICFNTKRRKTYETVQDWIYHRSV